MGRRRVPAAATAAVVVTCLLAACGSSNANGSDGSGGPGPGKGLGAAEPSVAPTQTAVPYGQTVEVGSGPEGIVYDPQTGMLAVGVRNPDRLVLVDAATLRVTKQIPIAGHVRHLQLAGPGGPVIVPEEDADTLALVAIPGGTTTSFAVGKSPHDATAVDGGYVAGDEFGRSFTLVTGHTARTVTEVDQPGGVVGYGDTFALVDVGDFSVSTWNVSDGTKIAQLPAGSGPTHGARVGDKLVVTDTRGGHLITYRENPLKQLSSIDLPGGPYGIAVDPTGPVVWVTLTATNQVVGYDVSGDTPRELERLTTVDQPDTVAADGADIWVAGKRAGVVQHLTRFTR